MPAAKDLLDKIGDKVLVGDGCWEWTGHVSTEGYGVTNRMVGPKGARRSKHVYAHRLFYELFKGPIPEGLHLDHLCHTNDQSCPGNRECSHRRCVRPSHLEAVTQAENNRRAPGNGNREKTRCVHGHEYTPENTYRAPRGSRECRTCMRARRKRQ